VTKQRCGAKIPSRSGETEYFCDEELDFGDAICRARPGHKIEMVRWYPEGGAVKHRLVQRVWRWYQPGVLDESSISTLRDWQDHALAIQLGEKLGKTLAMVMRHNGVIDKKRWDEMIDAKGRISDKDANLRWAHAVVDLGDDRYLDVDGVSSRDQLLARWQSTGRQITDIGDPYLTMAATDGMQLCRLSGMSVWHTAVDLDWASGFVDLVLARYAEQLEGLVATS